MSSGLWGLETAPVFATYRWAPFLLLSVTLGWVLSWWVSERHQCLKMVSRPDFTGQFKVWWFSSHLVGWEDTSESSFGQPIIHFQAATTLSRPLYALPQCSLNKQLLKLFIYDITEDRFAFSVAAYGILAQLFFITSWMHVGSPGIHRFV